MNVLEVKNLTKKYKDFVAVNDISFSLKKGEILGLLGPNGAGKTTTVSMLLGLISPTTGKIDYFGKDLNKNRSKILSKVGFSSAYTSLPAHTTVEGNLEAFARLYGIKKNERKKIIEKLLKKLEISHLGHEKCWKLSSGEMMRATIAKAFIMNPEIVLLDEPTATLDVNISKKIRNFILAERQKGVSFIFTSHNMRDASELCDRVLVINNGKIIANKTPNELAQEISNSFVTLMADGDTEKLVNFAKTKKIEYEAERLCITLEIEETDIANFLQELANNQIRYTQISIKHPTLEDYFLSIQKNNNAIRRQR